MLAKIYLVQKKLSQKILLIAFCAISSTLMAQHDSINYKISDDVYQIKLRDTVKCIQQIEYEKTGEPIKGYLDDDKTLIYLENYKVNNKVRLRVIYESGREEEILRSPCSIELKYTL